MKSFILLSLSRMAVSFTLSQLSSLYFSSPLSSLIDPLQYLSPATKKSLETALSPSKSRPRIRLFLVDKLECEEGMGLECLPPTVFALSDLIIENGPEGVVVFVFAIADGGWRGGGRDGGAPPRALVELARSVTPLLARGRVEEAMKRFAEKVEWASGVGVNFWVNFALGIGSVVLGLNKLFCNKKVEEFLWQRMKVRPRLKIMVGFGEVAEAVGAVWNAFRGGKRGKGKDVLFKI